MAIKSIDTEHLTFLQEEYRNFWTIFNQISSCDSNFFNNFKVHTIASIKYHQDYSVGKPYHICIKLPFNKKQVSIQAYFSNIIVYNDFFTLYKNKIEALIGKRLVWKEMQTKAYAQLNLSIPLDIRDKTNWEDICKEIIPYAVLMKTVFDKF